MTIQKEILNGVACITDTTAPGVPVTDLAGVGGDIVALNASKLRDVYQYNTPTIFVASSSASDKEKNLADYVCDGVDDHVQIQAASDSLGSSGGTVRISPGTYVCNATLDFAPSCNLVLDNVTLNFSSQSAFIDNCNVRFYGGAQAALPAQSGDEVVGNRTWSFASAHGLSVGDVVAIENTTDNSYSGYRTTYRKKERFVVRAVPTTTTIETCEGSKLAWTAAESTWTKLPNETPSISGTGLIIGSGDATDGDSCVRMENVVYPRITGVRVRGADVSGINLIECYGAVINSIHAMKEIDDGGAGLSYGLVVSSCQDVRIVNSILHGDRHGIAVGGAGLNIDIHTSHCTVTSNLKSAADWHGNVIYSSYTHCAIYDGIAMGGNHNAVSNCVIRVKLAKAITLSECSGFDHVFTANRILGLAAATYGIHESDLSDDCTEGGTLVVDGFVCETPVSAASGTPVFVGVDATGPTAAVSYDISRVSCTNHGVASSAAINISAANGTAPASISIRDCRVTGSIIAKNAVAVDVANCQVINSNSHGVYTSEIVDKGFIRNCTVEGMTAGYYAFFVSGVIGGGSTCIQVLDCMLFGDSHTLLYIHETSLAIVRNVRTDTVPSSRIIRTASTVAETHISEMNFTNLALVLFAGTKHYLDVIGTGTPESTLVCSAGSIYRRIDGGVGSTLYVKESADTSAGWTAASITI